MRENLKVKAKNVKLWNPPAAELQYYMAGK